MPRSVLFPEIETFANPVKAAKNDLAIARYAVLSAQRELTEALVYLADTRGHRLRPVARMQVRLAIKRIRETRKTYSKAIGNVVDVNSVLEAA